MTVAIDDLVRAAAAQLHEVGVPNAEEEARCIAEAALASAGGSDTGEAMVTAQFVDLVRRRSARMPLQRLLGSVRFRNIELQVGDGVFLPQPETGPVVEWCVDAIAREGVRLPRVIDLCTGSGVVALALANELVDAEVHAVEIDPSAFAWASRNADARAAAGDAPIVLHLCDINDLSSDLDNSFDLVASNPPYVAAHEIERVSPEVREYDPRRAIEGGPDGLDLVRAVERVAARLLKPGGLVVVEHSDRQGRSAPAVFAATGRWVEIEDHVDHEGRDRFVTARLSRPGRGGASGARQAVRRQRAGAQAPRRAGAK